MGFELATDLPDLSKKNRKQLMSLCSKYHSQGARVFAALSKAEQELSLLRRELFVERAACAEAESKLTAFSVLNGGQSQLSDDIYGLLGIKPPPKPEYTSLEITKGLAFASVPGNYFSWAGETVAYVGASANVAARLGSHHVIKDDDPVSFVPQLSTLDAFLAEGVYIWILRPFKNKVCQL